MSLSVVIPVYNALDCLKETLISVTYSTANLSEIILVDDHSREDTREFIETLRMGESLDIRLIKTRNPKHSWTNASWNMGVKLATQPYIAILNSDIILSSAWDDHLIASLQNQPTPTIACPFEDRNGKLIKLDSLIEKHRPDMIAGSCFMFTKESAKQLFPIPENLVHWCGDNYLADRSKVVFNKRATITHKISQSVRTIPPEVYYPLVRKDVLSYQSMSGRDMSWVLKEIDKVFPEAEALSDEI